MTRRDEILAYIAEYCVDHHNAPSTREIARAFDIAQQTAYHHLLKLMVEGKVIQVDGRLKLTGAEYIPPDTNTPKFPAMGQLLSFK